MLGLVHSPQRHIVKFKQALYFQSLFMNVGDKAPEILGLNEKGEEIHLSDYKGKKSCFILLSQRYDFRMYGTGMQLA